VTPDSPSLPILLKYLDGELTDDEVVAELEALKEEPK